MQLTDEQNLVIAANGNLVINAVAGSGKTTTLIEFAKTRPPGSKILYLAFNKTVKTEALAKFHAAGLKHVKVETAHSLAYDHVVKGSNYQVSQGYKSYELCDILDIQTGDRHTDYIIATHVSRFLSMFCNSKATKVQELDYREEITDVKAKAFVINFYSRIEQLTRELLAKMDKGEIAITHDFYLKKFQLGNPVLPYDYILFDEGQDASAAMLAVFLQQKGVKIIVGDIHQQIYGWRYAVNSLQQVEYPVFHLSNSFRFDDEVALIANKIIGWKKHLQLPASVKVKGVGEAGELISTRATLGRTNLSILLNAIAQWQHGEIKSVYFEGNISSYTFADEGASLYDILSLYNGKHDKIKDKLIASMKTMKDLDDYIEKTEDTSMKMIADVVKEFGNRLPGLISELKNNHASDKESADMIFSTVHRCKGMEYDEVTLLGDFITEDKLKKQIALAGGTSIDERSKNKLAEEINILYVAVTRARYRLRIPPEINPLRTVQLSEQPMMQLSNRTSLRKYLAEETMPYQRMSETKSTGRTGNHGKRWTDEEEEVLLELYKNQYSVKEMAKSLGRGEAGVKIKLMNLGLLDDGELY
ncbi:MAG: UvrD-helicase domain-containing protein [Bacteroidetes bacterium]|nr:UvrD-helicase domain-containing protein [Bacteroidota bacterium]